VAFIIVIDKTKKPDSFCYRAFRKSQTAALAVFVEATFAASRPQADRQIGAREKLRERPAAVKRK
jgi:hypothetical protein